MNHEHDLIQKMKELVDEEDPLVRQVVSLTLDEVNNRSLSVEATAKRMERKIDGMLQQDGRG
ncbi:MULTISPECIES: hypothetical protein [Pontibacillus]|uniref:Uncharacterized protein n=1 Tax=Pontibacillus chungwhensis TaxID=265426 RepID=A0ABY8V3R6_9BACI|nr:MULTISPECIES: hypothetical protein [Pontibacillus]MCD5324457.1 hypothetical protein [Pontibacillus sp. HN14]WIF99250.1 hypothetical protein QNI29_06200 [Pontibacillus chungwhensis]